MVARIDDTPVLYVMARDDLDVPEGKYRRLAAATPAAGTRFPALPRGGHAMDMLGIAEPSQFYRGAFSDFLAKHTR